MQEGSSTKKSVWGSLWAAGYWGRVAVSLCLAHFHFLPWVAVVGHHRREDALGWLLGWFNAVAPVSNTCRQRSALIHFPYPQFDSDGNTSPYNRHEYMRSIYFIFCSCFIWTWIFQPCLGNHKKSESCFVDDRSEELSWWVVNAKHKTGQCWMNVQNQLS